MTFATISLFGALLAFGVAAPAPSQLKPRLQTGSIIPVKPHALDPKEAAVIRKGFAQCVFRDAKPKALELLAHSDIQNVDARSAGITNIVRDLKLDTCLGEQAGLDQSALSLQFPVDVLRDLIAEEAYLASNPSAPTLSPDAAQLVFKPVSAGEQLAIAQGLATFADCTVRRNSRGADALLRTTPGGEQERNAAAVLAPDLGACLVAGQTLSLKAANIRALMAYAMWSRFGRSERANLEAAK